MNECGQLLCILDGVRIGWIHVNNQGGCCALRRVLICCFHRTLEEVGPGLSLFQTLMVILAEPHHLEIDK